eukprot:scaffold1307_cov200-Pinguiococcus_pyrenoidosus.AAC.108
MRPEQPSNQQLAEAGLQSGLARGLEVTMRPVYVENRKSLWTVLEHPIDARGRRRLVKSQLTAVLDFSTRLPLLNGGTGSLPISFELHCTHCTLQCTGHSSKQCATVLDCGPAAPAPTPPTRTATPSAGHPRPSGTSRNRARLPRELS